jgi:hypothetical protein
MGVHYPDNSYRAIATFCYLLNLPKDSHLFLKALEATKCSMVGGLHEKYLFTADGYALLNQEQYKFLLKKLESPNSSTTLLKELVSP